MRALVALLFVLASPAATECGKREDRPLTVLSRHNVAISSPLPWTYSLHGVLQQCEPSAVVEPLDYGGTRSAAVPLVSLDGSTWTGTFFRYHGLDVNDPYQPGRPLLVPAVEDVVISVAPHAAAAPARAYSSDVGMRLREFDSSTHVAVSSLNTGRALHARSPEPGSRFRYFTRDHITLSTPLARRAQVLLSGTGQWAATEESETRLLNANAWLRYAQAMRDSWPAVLPAATSACLPAHFQPASSR